MFTPIESAIGAVLMQCATTAAVVCAGRTIGMSSAIYEVVTTPSTLTVTLIIGMLLSVYITSMFMPDFIPSSPGSASNVPVQAVLPLLPSALITRLPSSAVAKQLVYTIAGLLVGVGTCWGSGCTSGHMLCGLSRLRLRSIVATITFSATAMFLVNTLDSAPGCGGLIKTACSAYDPTFSTFKRNASPLFVTVGLSILSTYVLLPRIILPYLPRNVGRLVTGLYIGIVFGLGLLISGMADLRKPLRFLAVFHPYKFDPSLGMIILFAILPNIFVWSSSFIKGRRTPAIRGEEFRLPSRTDIPLKMLSGNVLFGIGWGLLGICPGPAVLALLTDGTNAISWMLGFFLGYGFADSQR